MKTVKINILYRLFLALIITFFTLLLYTEALFGNYRVYVNSYKLTDKINLLIANETSISDSIYIDKVFFNGNKYEKKADYKSIHFEGGVDFTGVLFLDRVKYEMVRFGDNADFRDAIFKGNALFVNSVFKKEADFIKVKFYKKVNFKETVFYDDVEFENCEFLNDINISGTRFEKGVDLRRIKINKRTKILFNNKTYFPKGALYADWNILKNRFYFDDRYCSIYNEWFKDQNNDNLKKQLHEEQYELTKIFYELLRDNYLVQNDKKSADAVMFELAKKRADIKDEKLWVLYGLIMGYGYKPLVFITVVFLFIYLPFTLCLYNKYYDHHKAFFNYIDDDQNKNINNKEIRLKSVGYEKKKKIDLVKISYVMLFSSAVFLSVRYKKEWINKDDYGLLLVVVLEWITGLALYVLFVVLVKTYEFSYIKGLLGL
jgi:hypothetical protein